MICSCEIMHLYSLTTSDSRNCSQYNYNNKFRDEYSYIRTYNVNISFEECANNFEEETMNYNNRE